MKTKIREFRVPETGEEPSRDLVDWLDSLQHWEGVHWDGDADGLNIYFGRTCISLVPGDEFASFEARDFLWVSSGGMLMGYRAQ